ncbi:MAG: TIGR02679 domain-containing protein [Roseburia sp.]|nr:TIGR02679 domain-containing protein [Roseburia sp.]
MSSSELRECVAYFKKEQGFDRCFQEMRKKWKSYGKAAGNIKIRAATEKEKHAIGHFLSRKYWDEDIVFPFFDFEKALKETRFGGVPLERLLEYYFEEELVTNQEKKALEERKKEEFWSRIAAWLEEKGETKEAVAALAWIQGMEADKQYGYGTVMGLWKNSERLAETMVRNVCQGYLSTAGAGEAGIPLAVLAAKVSGNPHYFDRGQNAAVLLLHVLCFADGREFPRDAAGVHEAYRDAGIITDEIASTVAFYRIHMRKEGVESGILEAFCAAQEPGILSLANLTGAEAIWAERECAYVVENEMVFSYLVKCCREMPVTLLCTSGQLSYAAQRLIHLLCENGTKIYYSGDMDPEGIGIADRLWRKYPRNIHIWRMDVKDYQDALSEEEIEEWRMKKLRGVEHPLLCETAECVRQTGRSAYQENILELLAQDILYYRK